MRRLLRNNLHATYEHRSAKSVLDLIDRETACIDITNQPHTILDIVAHMDWWQKERIKVARGEMLSKIEPGQDDWPDADPDDWERLKTSFENDIQTFEGLIDTAPIDNRIFDELTIGEMLMSHPVHNSYHLGQIVVLLRILGKWND